MISHYNNLWCGLQTLLPRIDNRAAANSTFVFLPTLKQTLKNQKSCFLPTNGQTNKEMNEMYIEK